jgi:hypothetical protein
MVNGIEPSPSRVSADTDDIVRVPPGPVESKRGTRKPGMRLS